MHMPGAGAAAGGGRTETGRVREREMKLKGDTHTTHKHWQLVKRPATKQKKHKWL